MLRPSVLLALLAAFLGLVLAPCAAAEAPHFYSPPYILGANPPTVGSKISGENGGVFCMPSCYGQTVQWFHCAAGTNFSNCVAVSDLHDLLADDKYYTVQESDVGWSLVAQVTAWNHDCNENGTECRDSHTTVNSAPTAAVPGTAGGAGGTGGTSGTGEGGGTGGTGETGGTGGTGGTNGTGGAAALTVTPAKLFPATPGIYYSVSFDASGGAEPYTCTVAGGMPPLGTSFSGCTLSGIPLAAPGLFTFSVTVTDKNGVTGTKTFSIVVSTPVIVATPLALSTASAGSYYTQALGATGGIGPYTFTVSEGVLPLGLTLAEAGVLSGTPASAGTYLFTVRIVDSNTVSTTQSYRLVVERPAVPLKKPPKAKSPKKKAKSSKTTSPKKR